MKILTVLTVNDKILLTSLSLHFKVNFVEDSLKQIIFKYKRREDFTHKEKLKTENEKKRDKKKEKLKEKEKEITEYLL